MLDLVVFKVANSRYALNIENIQRIIEVKEPTTIANAHEYIDGMMSHEGNIIKVLNFAKLVGLNSDEQISKNQTQNSAQKLIIYEKDGSRFAIKVDKIDDISHINESDIMSPSSDYADGEFLEISGILDLNTTLINVIQTVRLPK